MTDLQSPWQRSIGIKGITRFVITIAGVVAVAAAFLAQRVLLGVAAALFLVIALVAQYVAGRAAR